MNIVPPANTHPTFVEFNRLKKDPDDEGNSWQGMYRLLRCPIPGDKKCL